MGEAIKWRQFLGDVGPVTVLLGMERIRMSGQLIPYPESKQGTTGNVIPWVEFCHRGSIPVSAVVSYLLVCAADYTRFMRLDELTEQTLTRAETEFGVAAQHEREEQSKFLEKLCAVTDSPEFNARMEKAKHRAEEMRRKT